MLDIKELINIVDEASEAKAIELGYGMPQDDPEYAQYRAFGVETTKAAIDAMLTALIQNPEEASSAIWRLREQLNNLDLSET